MEKQIEVILSEEANDVYIYLKQNSLNSKEDRMLVDAIERIFQIIKREPFHGVPIAKKKIPKYYKERYGTRSLFRIELPLFWRMLYTVRGQEIKIISFIVDILDHKKYNKKFGYRNK